MGKKLLMVAMAAIIMAAAGCAAPEKKRDEAVFFPAAPNLPRLQFLASFTGAADIEAAKTGFESFVTGEQENRKRLDKPYGVAMYDGKIYVCDTNNTVMVFDMAKNTFEPLKGAKGIGKLIQPLNISIDGEGNKYVSDPIRKQVVIFDKDDLFVKALGKQEDWKPVDAVFFGGMVYVADMKNAEIRVYDRNTGEVVKTFGQKGEQNELLGMPSNLAFDNQGNLYVVDSGRFQIVKFDRDGHFLTTIGSVGTNMGHFGRPRGIAIDRENRAYVVDASFYNVQIFNDKGQLLFFFGEGGTAPGTLILPAGIYVDYDDLKYFEKYVNPSFQPEFLLLVTSQFGDRMVNVFAYGKEKGKKYPTDQELLEEANKLIESQSKQETPKAEGGKQEIPKAEGEKQETPKVEGGKQETPKAEGEKQETPKVEGGKQEQK